MKTAQFTETRGRYTMRAEFAPSLHKCGLQQHIITDAYGGDVGIIDYARRLIS